MPSGDIVLFAVVLSATTATTTVASTAMMATTTTAASLVTTPTLATSSPGAAEERPRASTQFRLLRYSCNGRLLCSRDVHERITVLKCTEHRSVVVSTGVGK
jgi:hypothetical protein